MRKTNLNIKRVKFFKCLLVFFVVQIVFAAIFIIAFDSLSAKDENDLKKAEVTVDRVEYKNSKPGRRNVFGFGRRYFRFSSDGDIYVFPSFSDLFLNEYDISELYETVKVGDNIVVGYIEKNGDRFVYFAQKGNETLRSLEGYNRYVKKQNIIGIIMVVIFELVYLAVLFLFVLLHIKDLKFFSKKKKRRKYK